MAMPTIKLPLLPPDQQIATILAYAKSLESMNGGVIHNRDEWLVTLAVNMLTDPNHHVGRVVGRSAFRTWIERGGKVPKEGPLERTMREPSQFLFGVQYLYDMGLSIKDIAMAFGAFPVAVENNIQWLNQEGRKEQIRNELAATADKLNVEYVNDWTYNKDS